MRIAILADIHGNLPALEAVHADLRAQGADFVYLAGDQISRVPWNNEVMDLIAAEGWPAIYGNHEWTIGIINTPRNVSPFTDRERFITLWWTQETLRREHLETIRVLPAELRVALDGLPPLRIVHGIPGDVFRGIFPFTPGDAVADAMRTVDEPFVIMGHTHRPLDRSVRRWRILNGGSVGLPYNGDTRAQYLILEGERGKWTPIFRQVEFDRSGLRARFESSGMLAAVGVTGELHVLTAETGQPWSSDFAYWLHQQPAGLYPRMELALEHYLKHYGPERWCFDGAFA